jgi:hypothetical protein
MAGSRLVSRHIAALKKLDELEGRTSEAGWFESARYPAGKVVGRGKGKRKFAPTEGAGMQVAHVARIQEFGAVIKRGKAVITIPARPFMRLAWSRFRQDRTKIQASIARQLIAGKIEPEQALGQIALALEGCIVRSIKSGPWAPNSAVTAKAKGFDKPLIDTAFMWQSVSSKVS